MGKKTETTISEFKIEVTKKLIITHETMILLDGLGQDISDTIIFSQIDQLLMFRELQKDSPSTDFLQDKMKEINERIERYESEFN